MYRLICPTAAATITAAASLALYTLSPFSTPPIITSTSIPTSFARSYTIRNIVNPKDHVDLHDSRSVTVSVPKGYRDEKILAMFVKGFFGGYVFGIERSVFQLLRPDWAKFLPVEHKAPTSRVWRTSELSEERLPEAGTTIFGTFQVVESRILTDDGHDGKEEYSYTDIAFGWPASSFAGAHRFSVLRSPDLADRKGGKNGDRRKVDAEDVVTIEFYSLSCNPTQDRSFVPDFVPHSWMEKLHRAYAFALFKEAVVSVQSYE